MWSDASTTALFVQMTTSVGSIIYTVLSAVLVVAVGLLGVGFAYRQIRKHVTGGRI